MAKKRKSSAKTEPVHIAVETLPEPKETAKLNKSEEIRIEARRIMDDGGTPRPKDIVEALAARGVDVVSPQVSQVLKRLGVPQRPRKRKAGGSAGSPLGSFGSGAPAAAPAHRPAGDESFTLHELIAAKQFSEMIGSPARAKSLLDALDRIM